MNKSAHWAQPIAETPKTFLVHDVEELVGSPLPSLAKVTREDLAKLAGALQDTSKLVDEVKILRDLSNKLAGELKSVRDERNRLHDEVLRLEA